MTSAGAPRADVTDSETQEPQLEIRTLLAAAFETEPSAELSDRVVRRVALGVTIAEFLQMFSAAPTHLLRDNLEPDDGGNDDSGEAS